jgi:alpha-L-fucosidase
MAQVDMNKRAEELKNPPSTLMAKPPKDQWKAEVLKKPIRAFCVDFNWQVKGAFRFAAPGDWADADPAAQVKWCKEAGVNCIQTFILSCNGHAWYKGGPIPEQPGLKHDFLTEVAKQGHQQKMLVMGYYCISANSLWGKNHPDQSYGTPSTHHIPLTKDYVEYLCRSVRDVLKRTEIDGFMLDWMQNTSGKWLDCEKTMYAELMGVPFPGADKVTAADKAAFDQKAVERCWTSIRDAARGVKPDCILWPNFLHHMNLEGVDWLLNEGPDPRETEAAEQRLGGRPVRLIQNQVGWPNHDARKVFSKSKYNTWDFYGFAAPYDNGLPLPVADYLGKPIDEFKGTDRMAINDKNIAALVRFYLGKPVELAASETALSCGKPATASSTWGAGFEADKAIDGDAESRWGAAPDTRSGWLEVDLGRDTVVDCAVIKELGLHRTEAFAVEYKAGDNWKELIKGSTIAGEKVLKFTPVTARNFRLNILKANEVPTIEEFQLYAPGTKITATAEKPRDPKLKWFDEAKYGLFINWGLYSIPAGEWKGKKYENIGEWIMYDAKIPAKEYQELAKQFNPQKFNAEAWAQLAEDAGMKYLVFDCKHHDGFALYKSEVSKHNCFDATPWKRDPFKELQEACKKRNIKLCFYYSQATDWNEPNGGMNNWDFKEDKEKDFDQYLRDKSMPQVAELLKNYGPIGLIWFDVPVLMTPERSKKLADLVRSIQPDVLINSRLGEGKYHDYRSMGDNEIPHAAMDGAWETAATVNDTWGYKTDDHNWKQPDNITFKLVDIASKGGNYLLNVGPDADGFIPQPSQDILRKVGKWLKVNGEAVYGVGRTPFGDEFGKYDPEKKDNRGRPVFNETTDWRCTVKPIDWTWSNAGKLYLHFFKWPGAKFELAGFNGKVEKAYMLADSDRKALKCSVTEGKLTIVLPEKATDEIDSVLCIEVKK